MQQLLLIIAPFIVAPFAQWLITRVPSLNPDQARDVAKSLVDYGIGTIAFVGTACALWIRRPGDTKKPVEAPAPAKAAPPVS